MSQVQIQNPSAALAGSQILTKAPTLAQPLSIPSTTSSLPSENAGRPIQNSALPSASVTSTSAAAGQGSAVLPVSVPRVTRSWWLAPANALQVIFLQLQ